MTAISAQFTAGVFRRGPAGRCPASTLDTFVGECDRPVQKFGPRFAPSAWLRERAARGQAFY